MQVVDKRINSLLYINDGYLTKKMFITRGFFSTKGVFMNNHHDIRYATDSRIGSILYAVYAWMAVALAITASIAYCVGTSPAMYTYLMGNTWLVLTFMIAQLALVFGLMLFLERMSAITAMIMFILYSVLTGITLSSIFIVFTTASIATTFLVASGMFGSMALYGYFTKTDLTSVGSIGIMMLFGLIIGGIVNLFLRSSTVEIILSAVGVIVFSLLIAFDVQKIKQISRSLLANQEVMTKISIICALTLYLDFINLFLYLLQFFGKKKEQ